METQETSVWSLGQEDPLEEEMAINSSILAWKVPWTEEPNGPQSMGSKRTGHDWVAENPCRAHACHACQPMQCLAHRKHFMRICSSPLLLNLWVCAQRVQLFAMLWTVTHQATLSMGFFRQEYWSGLPFLPPGDLPNPGIKPPPSGSQHCRQSLLPLSHQGNPC